mgnify:CR=1 FL=1
MPRFLALCFLVLGAHAAEPAPWRAFVLGDWGWADPELERRYPLVRQNADVQRAVAKAMAERAARTPIAAVLTTGDNFYPNGVASAADPRWRTSFEEVYAAAGERMADHVTLRQLQPGYRIFWTGEERHFDFGSDREQLRAEMRKFSHEDAARLDAFLDASGAIHREGILVSGRRNFLGLGDFVKLLPTMARLDAIRFLEGWVARFFKEPHVQQAFGFHSLFIGGDPSRVPAIYSALAYLQVADGIWYTEGGVYGIIESFGRIIGTMGGTIRTGIKVDQILHRNGRATGVRTADGELHAADLVVYNGDVTARDALLPDAPDSLPWRLRPLRTTMSAHMLYLGTNRTFEKLLHHTLVVGDDYHGFIRDVTRDRRMPRSSAEIGRAHV